MELYPSKDGEFPVLPNMAHRVALGNATAMDIVLNRYKNKICISVLGKGCFEFKSNELISKESYPYVQDKLGLGNMDGDAMHLVDFINSQNGLFDINNIAGTYSNNLSDKVTPYIDTPEFTDEEMAFMQMNGYTVVPDASGELIIEPYGYDFSEDQLQNVVLEVIEDAKSHEHIAVHACLAAGIFQSDDYLFSHDISIAMPEIKSNSDSLSDEQLEVSLINLADRIHSDRLFRKELVTNATIECVADMTAEIVDKNTATIAAPKMK